MMIGGPVEVTDNLVVMINHVVEVDRGDWRRHTSPHPSHLTRVAVISGTKTSFRTPTRALPSTIRSSFPSIFPSVRSAPVLMVLAPDEARPLTSR
jgi:hypothetical protein